MWDASANGFRLEVPSRAENVALVRLAVAALAAGAPFGIADLEEIRVAVSEAVTNAIVHGYAEDAGGMVVVEASLDADRLAVVVEDRGRGMEDVALARAEAADREDERLGLGLMFMETFMDRVSIDSSPGTGTRVTMEKRRPPAAVGAVAGDV
jgi:stage II sporulation protein AB (anti-sigma F factor)